MREGRDEGEDDDKWFDEEEAEEGTNRETKADGDDGEDPLDAFMKSLEDDLGTQKSSKREGEEVMERVEDYGHADAAEMYEQLEKKRRLEESDSAGDDDEVSPNINAAAFVNPTRKQFRASEKSTESFIPEIDSDEEDECIKRATALRQNGGGCRIPPTYDWETMLSERQRPSRIHLTPSVAVEKTKSFYKEAETITNTPFEAIARLRRDLRIITSGLNVPKCIRFYEDLQSSFTGGFLERLIQNRIRQNICPEPLECQFLPTLLSGRNTALSLPPEYPEESLISDYQSLPNRHLAAVAFDLYGLALCKILAIREVSKLKSPNVVLACSDDARTRQLASRVKAIYNENGDDISIGVVLCEKSVSQMYDAGNSELIIGTAEALVALNAHNDMLPLEDVLLLAFVDVGASIEYDASIAHVLVMQTREDKQLVLVSSSIDSTVDSFIREHFSRPVRIQVDCSREIFKPESGIEYRFMNMATDEKKLTWLTSYIPKITPYGQIVIFCANDTRVDELMEILMKSTICGAVCVKKTCTEYFRSDELKSAKIIVTTSTAAAYRLRGFHAAAVIHRDPPISAHEFVIRSCCAGVEVVATAETSRGEAKKAHIYTILNNNSEKVAAYIAEAFIQSLGRKNVPKTLDDIAFRYGPYKKSLLEATTMPPERLFPPATQTMSAKHGASKKKAPVCGTPMNFVKSQRKGDDEKARGIEVIVPAEGMNEDASSSSAASSSVLNTAKLKARRDANLAAFQAERLANQLKNLTSATEDTPLIDHEKWKEIERSAKLLQASEIAAAILARRKE